ncbi:hypothetical protein DERP_006549 [Dermatophagoides pteronyssinus]|uniref:Uncharacterized protein n=1 Tax=Dermatophagoides pteronyssinus TaxID=6956 RepID=A0ABQ8IQX8_DERPT|nr:hypothetical protein DERP_006549 [Dermatophagoides pteronyssinus]
MFLNHHIVPINEIHYDNDHHLQILYLFHFDPVVDINNVMVYGHKYLVDLYPTMKMIVLIVQLVLVRLIYVIRLDYQPLPNNVLVVNHIYLVHQYLHHFPIIIVLWLNLNYKQHNLSEPICAQTCNGVKCVRVRALTSALCSNNKRTQPI